MFFKKYIHFIFCKRSAKKNMVFNNLPNDTLNYILEFINQNGARIIQYDIEKNIFFEKENAVYVYNVLLLQKNGINLKNIKKELQTEDICKLAVQQNKLALKFVSKEFKTEDICKLAVQDDFDPDIHGLIKYVHPLKYVDKQTDEICKIAVQHHGLSLQYVKKEFKNRNLCKFAVQQNGNALQYVNKEFQTEEICIIAVKQDGMLLQFVKTQSNTICKFAVQKEGTALRFVNDDLKTEEICKLAVQQNGNALQYVETQTEEICILAVKEYSLALKYVKEQTKNICDIINDRCSFWDMGSINYMKPEFQRQKYKI